MILLTGFEPFAGASLNPSGEIAKRLGGHVLPVEYAAATARLLELIDENQPSAVVCLGQAEGRTTLSLEQVAINLDDTAIADNSGEIRINQPIDDSAATAYFTTLPIRELVDSLKQAGIPASVSLSAGAFVCNHIFFKLQRALAGKGIPSGFIHVPLIDEQSADFPGKPTLSLETQVRAIQLVLSELQ